MRKVLALCLAALIVLAIEINPKLDITGLFVQVTSTFITVVRYVVKEVLTAITNML
jgi:hypothetical protein